jgi:hypothetical protein
VNRVALYFSPLLGGLAPGEFMLISLPRLSAALLAFLLLIFRSLIHLLHALSILKTGLLATGLFSKYLIRVGISESMIV